MILTHEILENSRSPRGGWNRKQLELLGVAWPPVKGWKRKLIGTDMDDAKFAELMKLSGNDNLQSPIPVNMSDSADSNVRFVQNLLAIRAAQGLNKYGVTTERGDLSRIEWLRHAQAEALDLAIYLERLISDEEKTQPPPWEVT